MQKEQLLQQQNQKPSFFLQGVFSILLHRTQEGAYRFFRKTLPVSLVLGLGIGLCLSLCLSLCLVSSFAFAAESFPFLGEITADSVNVRAGPNDNFEKMMQLKAGDEVVVVGKNYQWYKIRLPGEAKIFISADFLKLLGGGVAEVKANRVNVRAGKGGTSSVLGQLNKGDLVRIAGGGGDWYRIEPLDQVYAWVFEDYVRFKKKGVPPSQLIERPARDLLELKTPGKGIVLVEKIQAGGVVVDAGVIELPLGKQNSKSSHSRLDGMERFGVGEGKLNKMVSSEIRYMLLLEQGKAYFLKGNPLILEKFLNQKVNMEGQLQPGPKTEYPVVLVTKILLAL